MSGIDDPGLLGIGQERPDGQHFTPSVADRLRPQNLGRAAQAIFEEVVYRTQRHRTTHTHLLFHEKTNDSILGVRPLFNCSLCRGDPIR